MGRTPMRGCLWRPDCASESLLWKTTLPCFGAPTLAHDKCTSAFIRHYMPASHHITSPHLIYSCSIWVISQPRILGTLPRLPLCVLLLDLAPKLHGYMPCGRDENTGFSWTEGLSTSSRRRRTKRSNRGAVGQRGRGISAHHRHTSGALSRD